MGNRERESVPVIQFHSDDLAVTITFSEEERVGVKAVILDILTEAYRERLQRASPICQGRMTEEGLRCVLYCRKCESVFKNVLLKRGTGGMM